MRVDYEGQSLDPKLSVPKLSEHVVFIIVQPIRDKFLGRGGGGSVRL